MKKIEYTLNQREIIKNREVLATLGHYLLNGFAADGDVTPYAERSLQEVMSMLIVGCTTRRQSQQETFDRMPWLANRCGRI